MLTLRFYGRFREAPWYLLVYLLLTVAASGVAFVLYGLDKRRAVRQGRRISERVLQRCALAGGWPGAVLAQQAFRHKTQKTSFRVTFWLIVLLHAAVIGGSVYWWWNGDRKLDDAHPAAVAAAPGRKAV